MLKLLLVILLSQFAQASDYSSDVPDDPKDRSFHSSAPTLISRHMLRFTEEIDNLIIQYHNQKYSWKEIAEKLKGGKNVLCSSQRVKDRFSQLCPEKDWGFFEDSLLIEKYCQNNTLSSYFAAKFFQERKLASIKNRLNFIKSKIQNTEYDLNAINENPHLLFKFITYDTPQIVVPETKVSDDAKRDEDEQNKFSFNFDNEAPIDFEHEEEVPEEF